MDFELSHFPKNRNAGRRDAIVLACASKQYFSAPVRASGAYPLLWTTNLMAPEAYTLKAALDGWIAMESEQQIRQRAAEAYSKYQKCSVGRRQKAPCSGLVTRNSKKFEKPWEEMLRFSKSAVLWM